VAKKLTEGEEVPVPGNLLSYTFHSKPDQNQLLILNFKRKPLQLRSTFLEVNKNTLS